MSSSGITADKLYPLKFHPVYQERVWGGTLMAEKLGRVLPQSGIPIGESWELSDRSDVQSVVSNGDLAGVSINELVTSCGKSLLGKRSPVTDKFPLLVKLIDAGERLSLQVHPDTAASRLIGNGAEPKTEMWYIIDTRPGAKILAGLHSRATRLQLTSLLDSPELETLMQVYPSLPGDAYYIPAGTIHAIGAGNLLLEIQQNSDTTYRISDWGRVGTDGKPRQLHREEGMKAIHFTNRTNPRIAGAVGKVNFNRKYDVVTVCPFFKVHDLRLSSIWNDTTSPGDTFHLLSFIHGNAVIEYKGGQTHVTPGETVLIPACCGAYTITPEDENGCVAVRTTL